MESNQPNNLNRNFSQLLRHRLKRVNGRVNAPNFPKFYGLLAAIILLVTTVIWTLLSANLQQINADQIVNSYLFENSKTFHGATFPSSHSFLLKWPLFYLINLFGVSGFSLALFTGLISLFTIGFLAFIIYRIERRPLYFGTLYLALASVLLLVPPVPYPGALLPANLAMITTRNLEYLLYIASLILLIKAPRVKTFRFGVATSLLALLMASDRLFLTLSVGGALLAFVFYRLRGSQKLAQLSAKWLISGLVAFFGALVGLWLINFSNLTSIASQSNVGPFGFVHSLKNVVLGSLYAVLGLFTNFGANPAYDTVIVRNIPKVIQSRLLGLGGVTYVINLVILAVGILASTQILKTGRDQNRAEGAIDRPSKLAAVLIFSTLAAAVAFIFTNHYYAVDARYLAIGLFAGFISSAVYLRTKNLSPSKLIFAGALLGVGIILGIATSVRAHTTSSSALASMKDRDSKVALAILHHPVDLLLGDYWRVVPIKFMSQSSMNVMPFSACDQPLDALSSKAWQPKLDNKKFAYLLSYDRSLTSYQNCTLDQIIARYGRPNTSSLISGSLKNPQEMLLFYDSGINKSAPTIQDLTHNPSTVSPISIDNLPNTFCQGSTILNIVAHQDDDLLFMNPDLLHSLKGNSCIRTVYLTAGDAGHEQYYWLSRELGSEAAYSNMLGYSGIWVKRIVQLSDNAYIRVDNPRGNSRVSIIFMRLPDGNVNGSGFRAANYESLARLEA
ncbi:hypothetical protein BVY00_01370, partial [bacterium G20]